MKVVASFLVICSFVFHVEAHLLYEEPPPGWAGWAMILDPICPRPSSGECSKAGYCCGQKVGSQRVKRTCVEGHCEGAKLVYERTCRIRCDEADKDAYGPWEREGDDCKLPATGECAKRQTVGHRCCGLLVGTMKQKRECKAAEGCRPDLLEKVVKCNIRCEKSKCKKWEFACDNGKCIKLSWKCDRQDDCGDHSDEKTCPRRLPILDDPVQCTGAMSEWTEWGDCKRPTAGKCAKRGTCCKGKHGVKESTRQWYGSPQCHPGTRVRKRKPCKLKCVPQCKNRLQDPKAFVTRTCDEGFGELSEAGTSCKYSCPDGYKTFPVSETTCTAPGNKKQSFSKWVPTKSPCCVADDCQTHKKLDLLFLIDTSVSIDDKFPKLTEFVKKVLGGGYFEIGPDAVRVAIAQFNEFVLPETELKLKDTTTKAALMNHLDSMRCCALRTNVGRAVGHMFYHHFSSEDGNRRGVPNVLVVITDGATTDKPRSVLYEYTEKARTKATLFAVKIGHPKSESQKKKITKTMSAIAGVDNPENELYIDDFDTLGNAVEKLATKILDASCNGCLNEEDRAEWTAWVAGDCSTTCGEGLQKFTRTCEGIGDCEGLAEETELCNAGKCD